MNVICLKKDTKIKNNVLIKKFRKNNIDVRGVWYPCDLLEMYKKNQKFKLSKVYEIAKKSICLPSGPNLSLKELNKIIKLV